MSASFQKLYTSKLFGSWFGDNISKTVGEEVGHKSGLTDNNRVIAWPITLITLTTVTK